MTPPPASSAEPLTLVLFGPPGSGKSSLLAALGRAAASQKQSHGGRIEDPGKGLSVISNLLDQPSRQHPAAETTSYPVRYIPDTADGAPSTGIDVVLVDSDGRAAGDILVHPGQLDEGAEGTLTSAIGDADALILVLDATTPENQLLGRFAEFARFLDAVQKSRGKRVEVAGFPVFLVLHKCDQLAKPGDGQADWVERIEQKKRELARRFQAFLDQEPDDLTNPGELLPQPKTDDEPTPPEDPEFVQEFEPLTGSFGRIALHVWATATRRPILAGNANHSQEPYEVAPLFRQALDQGLAYQARCATSGRRLVLLSGASVVFVGLLVSAIIGLLALHRNSQVSLLESRVRDFQYLYRLGARPGLSGNLDQLRVRKKRLDEIRANPLYPKLNDSLREDVDAIEEELGSYISLLDELLARLPPTSEQVEASLEKSMEYLHGQQQKLPPKWKDTPAGLVLKQRIAAGKALILAVQKARNWYLGAAEQAEFLARFSNYPVAADGTGIDWVEWTTQTETILSPNYRLPFRPNDPIPDMEGATLNYAAAIRFDTAESARRRWLEGRDALRRLLATCAAVGLATPREYKAPPVLVFSPDVRLSDLRRRLAELNSVYPDYEKRFTLESVPPRVRGAVTRAALTQYQRLLKLGQSEVLAQLKQAGKGTEETPARWETVRTWLAAPQELAAWRPFALSLLRLQFAIAVDPVGELATFLATKQFTIELDAITLEVGFLSDVKPRADAKLTINHPASMRQPALVFESSANPVRDDVRRVVSYTFRRSGTRRLLYKPGEALSAEMPLTGGKERLVWSAGPSRLYQLDRLHVAPRRQALTPASPEEGRLAADVRLRFNPEEGYPALPDLLPRVQLDD